MTSRGLYFRSDAHGLRSMVFYKLVDFMDSGVQRHNNRVILV